MNQDRPGRAIEVADAGSEVGEGLGGPAAGSGLAGGEVGVAERCGEFEVIVGERLVAPSVFCLEVVVVATEWIEVIRVGASGLGPRGAMVEVAVEGRHATSRMDAG